MNANLAYVLGTSLVWVGLILLLRALYLGVLLVRGDAGLDRARTGGGLVVTLVLGGLSLLFSKVGGFLPPSKGHEIGLPIVWAVLPLAGWLTLLCSAFAVSRLANAVLALRADETAAKFKGAGFWLALAAVCGWFWTTDGGNRFELLRGAIPLAPTTAAGLAALAVASVLTMVWAQRAIRVRGVAKAFVTHLVLLVGVVVFGLPFAWLVVTSFKEDKDMVATNGLIWVPKVKEQVPYLDPKLPLYETDANGAKVWAGLIAKEPDGRLKLDVVKPGALRGTTLFKTVAEVKEVPRMVDVVTSTYQGVSVKGRVIEDLDDGRKRVAIDSPASMKGQTFLANPSEVEQVRNVGLRVQNYTDALEFLPPETHMGLVYLQNTLLLVVLSVVGTLLSSSLVAYAFSRLRFPGKDFLFGILLSTMMLPAAVTLLPTFLIFRSVGWIDSLNPLWVPTFFGSAFNIFLLRQFFMNIPMELEDAAKIDGCSYPRTFWSVMIPQIKPALVVIAIWTFLAAWNNFMGPLIYVNSPENMPLIYALQLFNGDRSGEPGLLMAFATMTIAPVVALFFFAQRYFIDGVTLSGLGGR